MKKGVGKEVKEEEEAGAKAAKGAAKEEKAAAKVASRPSFFFGVPTPGG